MRTNSAKSLLQASQSLTWINGNNDERFNRYGPLVAMALALLLGLGFASLAQAETVQSDTAAPSAPVITDPADNSYNNTGTITFSGTAEANSTVELLDGEDPKDNATADGDGDWSKALTGVTDGPHPYTAKATDAAGNESGASDAVKVTVDTVAPDTTLTSGPSGPTNSTTATFAFSSNEPNVWFECKLDTGTFEDCTSSKTYSNLSEAPHTFEVRATDRAGNTDGTPANRTFTIDTMPPPRLRLTSIPPATRALRIPTPSPARTPQPSVSRPRPTAR